MKLVIPLFAMLSILFFPNCRKERCDGPGNQMIPILMAQNIPDTGKVDVPIPIDIYFQYSYDCPDSSGTALVTGIYALQAHRYYRYSIFGAYKWCDPCLPDTILVKKTIEFVPPFAATFILQYERFGYEDYFSDTIVITR